MSTLSGGEAQCLKLASELTRSGNVYVMDEPTTGLHPADIERLLGIVDPAARGRQHGGRHRAQPRRHHRRRLVVDLGPEGGLLEWLDLPE